MSWPRRILEECAVTDLQHLPLHMAAHLTGKIEAGVRLIDRLALRPGEVDEMTAVFQHLRAAGLHTSLVGEVGRG